MRYFISAVGRAGIRPEQKLYDHYRKRLRHPLLLREVEEKRPMSVAERIEREARLLKNSLPPGSVLVVLDEHGQMMASVEFAAKLKYWHDHDRHDIAFLIGGADGISGEIRQKADCILSLGHMTWPHLLVRVLLVEQLFRAETIWANHPYHRR